MAVYEDVQEFWVAERTADAALVGCGALHVMWEDLAELRTVAVDPECRGHKIGHRLVTTLLDVARDLGVRRVFVLTFETRFFGSFGFVPINGTPVPHERLRATAALVRRGRGRVPGPGAGQAEHPRQHPHAAAPHLASALARGEL